MPRRHYGKRRKRATRNDNTYDGRADFLHGCIRSRWMTSEARLFGLRRGCFTAAFSSSPGATPPVEKKSGDSSGRRIPNFEERDPGALNSRDRDTSMTLDRLEPRFFFLQRSMIRDSALPIILYTCPPRIRQYFWNKGDRDCVHKIRTRSSFTH